MASFPTGPVLVGLSGGADSAAMAWLAQNNGLESSALHINHGLPASPLMETAARRIADQLQLSLDVVEVVVADGPSPEAMARDARYEAFATKRSTVITAHTSDDNAETILINLIRGTGLSGLVGIPYHRPPYVYRPILGVSRSVTREIATLAGLEYADDPANLDQRITRNRVRNSVIPKLKELNPRIVESLNQMASNLQADARLLATFGPTATDQDTLSVGVLVTSPKPFADRLIMTWLAEHGIEPSSSIMQRLWSVVRGESAQQDLVGGAVVRRDRAVIEIISAD